jgi:hypothetical protein
MNTKVLQESFEKISEFEKGVNQDAFIQCFGLNLGNHLWSKFVINFKYSVSGLYNSLDTANRTVLCQFIENWKK